MQGWPTDHLENDLSRDLTDSHGWKCAVIVVIGPDKACLYVEDPDALDRFHVCAQRGTDVLGLDGVDAVDGSEDVWIDIRVLAQCLKASTPNARQIVRELRELATAGGWMSESGHGIRAHVIWVSETSECH